MTLEKSIIQKFSIVNSHIFEGREALSKQELCLSSCIPRGGSDSDGDHGSDFVDSGNLIVESTCDCSELARVVAGNRGSGNGNGEFGNESSSFEDI